MIEQIQRSHNTRGFYEIPLEGAIQFNCDITGEMGTLRFRKREELISSECGRLKT
jgi:hypothetical protein